MTNQFFHSLDIPGDKKIIASFALDKVTRTIELPDGSLMVYLNDFHNEFREVNKGKNGGKSLSVEEVTVYSEIPLNKEDAARFKKITEYGPAQLHYTIPEVVEEPKEELQEA